MKHFLLLTLISLIFVGCGGTSDPTFAETVVVPTYPFIARTDPNNGSPGDKILIYGYGFSVAPQLNFVTVGAITTTAEQYNLLTNPTATEIESIQFEVPANAPKGIQNVAVTVGENSSNSDVTFTVN